MAKRGIPLILEILEKDSFVAVDADPDENYEIASTFIEFVGFGMYDTHYMPKEISDLNLNKFYKGRFVEVENEVTEFETYNTTMRMIIKDTKTEEHYAIEYNASSWEDDGSLGDWDFYRVVGKIVQKMVFEEV